ncbi:MAG: type 1 periplasmic binding fold superfamily protein [Lewinella sp.]
MTNRLNYFLLAFVLVIFAASCEDDMDPIIDGGEELITSVTLTLTPNGPQETVVLGFSDPDGDGGNAPSFSTTGTIVADANYQGQISFAGPDGSIDAEILDEGAEHQVFYQTSGGANMDFSYATIGADVNGLPIGLSTILQTGAISSGELTVILRHEPNKLAAGIAIDNPSVAGGSTDVEVNFQVTIE